MSAMTRGASLRWKSGSFRALLAVFSAFWARSALAAICREGPNASPNTCSLPAGLGNFQGEASPQCLRTCTMLPRSFLPVSLHASHSPGYP